MAHDLIVVGGGAAGLAAAREGVRRGARTLLVTDGPLGGDCTFTGCIPSKTLLDAAARHVEFSDAMARVRDVVAAVAATETDEVLAGEGVEVFHGSARFIDASHVELAGRVFAAGAFVVATGARPARPPIDGLQEVPHFTTDTIFDLDRPPRSLVIVGGGPVGCELAQVFQRLGVQVTLVERLGRLLPAAEPEASACLAEVLTAEGVSVCVGQPVNRVEATPTSGEEGVVCRLAGGETITAARLLLAAGRQPDTGRLDLAAAGVTLTDSGQVATRADLRTTASRIYAAGDVTGRFAFTHAADEMGRIAAANALSRRRPPLRFRPSAIPWVVFTDPEVAHVGATEVEAAERGGARVVELPLAEIDRARVTAAATTGFVKLVSRRHRVIGFLAGGTLTGATIVAPRAGEMIHEAALAIRTKMQVARIAQTVHAYPTWSIALRRAAAQHFRDTNGRRARPARRPPAAEPSPHP